MATHNGIIETSSGDLLRAGFVNFTTGNNETFIIDVPIPAKIRDNEDFSTYHRWNGSSWIDIVNSPPVITNKALSFALSGQTNNNTVDPYMQVSSDAYTVIFQFNFPGTKVLGDAKKISCLCRVESALNAGSIRIYDVDNSNVIAEVSGLVSIEFGILDFGSINNLPESSAIFEIQAKTTTASKYIRMSNLTMEF